MKVIILIYIQFENDAMNASRRCCKINLNVISFVPKIIDIDSTIE